MTRCPMAASGVSAAALLAVALSGLTTPSAWSADAPPDDRDLYPEERLAARAAEGAETWERIWYREGSRARMKPYTDSGDLALFDDAIEFLDRKRGWWIPFDRIEAVELGKMRGDQEIDWILLHLREAEPALEVAIRDGAAFGFGHRTREIHGRIEARLRAAGAAQWDVPDGAARFDGLDHQLSFVHPASWTVRAIETEYRDGIDTVGVLRLATDGDAGIEVHRREDTSRKRCDGLGKDTRADLRREIAGSEAFLGGAIDPAALDEAPVEVGGCVGVRFRAAAGGRAVDVRAVSRRGTLFLFAVVGADGAVAGRAEDLDRLTSSVTFPTLRWEPAR